MINLAIIDDERDIINVLEKYLQRSNKYKIDTFINPESAHSNILNNIYDVILLDIMMPQKNGIDILKEMKYRNLKTKVVMMTAFSTLEKTIQAYDLGADNYVTKPFISLRDVEVKILDALER